jgi:hypothetical protein
MHSRDVAAEERVGDAAIGARRPRWLVGPVLLAMLAAGTLATATVSPARSADDVYLDRLLGRWDMLGAVLGKPVRYHARGERVLDGGFVRLHMIDAALDPQYVADVFIGYDAGRRDFIAHWLDRFGAAGARVVATGSRQGDQLIVQFPYADGAFRDTFTWIGERGEWQLLLETQQPNGQWTTFAHYTLRRATGARPAAGAQRAAPGADRR